MDFQDYFELSQLYADYASAVEETLHGEQVPSSYRYFIKRYFRTIRPAP